NITKFQTENDILIYNQDDDHIPLLLQSHALKRLFYQFSIKKPVATGAYYHDGQIILSENGEVKSEFEISEFSHLPGIHNHYNIMAAILACKTMNISDDMLIEHLKTFKGLEHRIEYVGNFAGIQFYNDSISTIPEATIAALKALKKVDVLILGGFDRGIEYTQLIQYLVENPVQHIAFTGPAGNRILTEWKASFSAPSHYIHTNNYSEIVDFAFEYGKKGKICLLSPAASSYNQFKNFEERGTYFKELVKNKK
ncbi:MAG: Mur ligase family protein, partial [Bacteroidales bacterium]